MTSKRDTVDHLGGTAGKGSQPGAPEASKVPETEEWTWMVDEDPAFYLSRPGRAEDSRM